jgi:hypothetical protein
VLGPPSRLKVRSTVYGTITVWLTVGAGVLLVVLVARRIIRRIRGGDGPHGEPDRPAPLVPVPQDMSATDRFPAHPPRPPEPPRAPSPRP